MTVLQCFSAIALVFLALFSSGCQSNADTEMSRNEILKLHQGLIDAHLNKDVDFLTHGVSDEFTVVSRGEISSPSKEELAAQFSNYLNNSTFSKYESVREPIIGFSKDGSIAWSIVQVEIAGIYKREDGTEVDIGSTWAWITLYEKRDDEWIRIIEVSNSM